MDPLVAWLQYLVIDSNQIPYEVKDEGFSGDYLERPGLDFVRVMVAGGGVDAVVLFRNRIARGVYAQLLSMEFHFYNTYLQVPRRA